MKANLQFIASVYILNLQFSWLILVLAPRKAFLVFSSLSAICCLSCSSLFLVSDSCKKMNEKNIIIHLETVRKLNCRAGFQSTSWFSFVSSSCSTWLASLVRLPSLAWMDWVLWFWLACAARLASLACFASWSCSCRRLMSASRSATT